MKYISTRGNSGAVSSAEAIFRGIAPDGGLYLPETVPAMSRERLAELCDMDYLGRARAVLSIYLDDYTADEVARCVDNAYGSGFEDNCPAPLTELVGGNSLLELWHGPTCAFKDMALQLLPELLSVARTKVGGGREVVILVATSGDTGKAALEGFADVEGTRIMVFYPELGVSPMQKRQMYTQQGGNVNVVAIEGNFDDAQSGVKAIFADEGFARELAKKNILLSSANSINWGRLLPQIVYYISAYCDLVGAGQVEMGDEVNFCVPTGNFGNILAAHYARRMGLPIGKLVCASNSNNVLWEHINTGVYDRNRPFFATSSPSMDILVSSNLERLLFELCGGDSGELCTLMQALADSGRFTLTDTARQELQGGFWGGYCDDKATYATIKDMFERYSYLCDTHTAVALNVAEQYKSSTGDSRPMVVVSTASPYKFAHSVLAALGEQAIPDDDFAMVRRLGELTATEIPAPIAALETAARRFTAVVSKDSMKQAVADFAV